MFLVISPTATFAQKEKAEDQRKGSLSKAKVKYICPIHPEVMSYEPGTTR